MRIVDLLSRDKIALGTTAQDKESAIDLLVDLQVKGGCLTDREAYKKVIMAREAQTSTVIEAGIAVPHAKSDCVSAPSLAACILKEGMDYGAMDGQPSNLFFIIAVSMDGNLHMEILSHLMVLLMDPNFSAQLRQAQDADAFMAVIDKFETAKYSPVQEAAEEKPQETSVSAQAGPQILTITACPTGIVHTYMAAEALEKKGTELGISVKVETPGPGGAKNVLTRQEIADCDGIIIVADKEVDLARFDGKPVLRAPVSDYHHTGETVAEVNNESFGCKLYKQLVNGVSHMLPFVIGGGILIALVFLLDAPSIDYANFAINTQVTA